MTASTWINWSSYAIPIFLAILCLFTINYFLSTNNILYYNTFNRVTFVGNYHFYISGQQNIDAVVILVTSSLLSVIATRSATMQYKGMSIALAVSFIVLFFLGYSTLVLSTLPFLSIAIFLVVRRKNIRLELRTFLSIFLIIIILIESLSLIRWIAYPIYPTRIYQDSSWYFAQLNGSYFYIIGEISGYLLLLISLNYAIRPMSNIFRSIDCIRKAIKLNIDDMSDISKQKYNFGLIVVIVLSALLPLWPHIVTINPDSQYISADVPTYASALNSMDVDATDHTFVSKIFNNYFDGDRPLTLVILYSLHTLLHIPTEEVVTYIPSFLSPLLVMSVIYLVKNGGYGRSIVLTSAVFTLLSYQVIVGVYAGLTANWLGLIGGYFMLGAVLASLRENSHTVPRIILILVTSVVVLLLHFYSWIFFAIAAILFLIWFVFRHKKANLPNAKAKLLTILLISLLGLSIVVDFARYAGTNTSSNVERTMSFVGRWGGFTEFGNRWQNLKYATLIYHGSFFTNAALYAAVLTWIMLFKSKSELDNMIIIMFSISSVTFLFTDYNLSSRIVLDLPMQVPFAIVLTYLIRSTPATLSKRLSPKYLAGVFLVIYSADYVLRSLSNMYFISPT